MPTLQQARDALELRRLSLPADPQVDEIRIDEYVDSDGHDALAVHVILSENVDVDAVPGSRISEIKSRIRSRLRNAGVTLFCYISFVKASELSPR